MLSINQSCSLSSLSAPILSLSAIFLFYDILFDTHDASSKQLLRLIRCSIAGEEGRKEGVILHFVPKIPLLMKTQIPAAHFTSCSGISENGLWRKRRA
jgi:hypothetical protein